MINNSSNLGEYRKNINDIEANYLLKNAKNNNIIQRQNSTSNYTTLINWQSDNVTYLKYNPQIGQHNSAIAGEAGIGTGESGAITILPYSTDTSPWTGTVGLYIGKNTLKLDGKNVLTSAGGTINGDLKLYNIFTDRKNSSTTIGVGSTWNDAPSLSLYGPNATSGVINGFQLRAGANACVLTGKADGSLSWNNSEIRFVKTTYSSGTTWYRVWSDGWIEQGGKYTGTSGTCWNTTITFPKAFSNTNYNVSVTSTGLAGDMWGEHGENVELITTSSFKYYFYTGASGDGTTGFYWTACGY